MMLVAVPALLLAGSFAFAPRAAQDAKQPLSVLYAGAPGGEREQAFVAFLEQHFAKVGSVSLEKLSMETAAPYDVVVADWKRRYVPQADGKVEFDSKAGHGFGLPRKFTKPIVMLGAVGGEIAPWSKIGWL